MTSILIGAAAVAVALAVIPFFIKKWWLKILLWVLAVLIGIGAGFYWYTVKQAEKAAEEERIRQETTELVFTGAALPEPEALSVYPNLKKVDIRQTEAGETYYQSLKRILPGDCEVLWTVRLTDGAFSSDVTELVLPGLNRKDFDQIPYFPNLKKIDATGSSDYDCLLVFPQTFPDIALSYTLPLQNGPLALTDTEVTLTRTEDLELLFRMLPAFSGLRRIDLSEVPVSGEQITALMDAYPEGELIYRVPVGDTSYLCTEEMIALSGSDPGTGEDLMEVIPLFQNLKRVDLHGTDLTAEEILLLKTRFPEIDFSYALTILGNSYESDTEEMDLKNTEAKAEDLISLLKPFSALKTVFLPEEAESDPSIKELEAAYPGVLFVHPVRVFGKTVSNDLEELDISKTKVGTPGEVEEQIALLPRLKKIIMNGCGLSNEEMGGLQTAHPEVKFVWTVRIGPHNVRTDAIGFSTKNPSKYTNAKATDAYNELVRTRKRLKEGDLENIKYCTDLVALDVGHNYLTNRDLEVLKYLPHLQILILADNKITDISAVASLKELRYIELFMNRIADMSPLVGLPDLIDINICNTHLESIEPLKHFTQAERLWFAMNGLTKEQNLEVVDALPNCLCNYTTTDETQEGWREHERYFWMRSFFQ